MVVFIATAAGRKRGIISVTLRSQSKSADNKNVSDVKLCLSVCALTFRLNLEDKGPMKHQRPLRGHN